MAVDLSAAERLLGRAGLENRDQLLRIVDVFLRVDELMGTISDLNRLLEQIMRESERAVGASTSSVLLYDPDRKDLYFEVALGPDGDRVKHRRLPVDESSIAGYCAMHQKIVNVPDARNDERWLFHTKQAGDQDPNRVETGSLLALPMVRQDRLIGVLEVLNKLDGTPFGPEDEHVMDVLASLAATAIENAQLFSANLRAERLAAIGQAVAGLSHYIKNVLSGLQGSISLMEEALIQKQYDILSRAIDILKRSSDKVSKLVKQMLTYSKSRQPDMRPVQVVQLLTALLEDLHQTAAAKGVKLEADIDPFIPPLMLDPTYVDDAVLNLVTNAIDACRERVDQEGEDYEPAVEVCAALRDLNLELTVADNAMGMTPEVLANIWKAFYSTKGSSGTGLGLAVTQKLVREHGGDIFVESQPGHGTVFIILLPARLAEKNL